MSSTLQYKTRLDTTERRRSSHIAAPVGPMNRKRSCPVPPSAASGLMPGTLVALVKTGMERQERQRAIADSSPVAPVGGPHDCVMQLPTMSAGVVELAGFDATGVMRYRVQLEADEDIDMWRDCILRRMRRRYPSRTLTLLG